MNNTEKRQVFRRMLAGNECVQPASVFDAMSARIADSLGFEIGMLAGSVASMAVLGAPDLVVLTLSEFAGLVRRITRGSELSLLVDADHGYGNALNVMRTVEELEAAGVSALTVEDTVLPTAFRQERAGEAISKDEMVGKLKAALAARNDPSLVIVGRTRAADPERLKAYTETGVDALFLTGVRSAEDLDAARKATTLPLMLGGTPQTVGDKDFLAANGVRVALAGHLPFHAAVNTVYESLKHLKENGSFDAIAGRAASDDLMALATRRDEYGGWQKEFLE
jgi:carboxyvinyl-carboxyphosphonate phosphorylmutase